MIYNTCLQPDSYNEFDDHIWVEEFIGGKRQFRYEHPHRKWEYGLAIRLAKELKPKTILNVGGGNSPLSSMFTTFSTKVTEIDPNKPSEEFPDIEYIHDIFPVRGIGKHDLVVCTSVIEHVEDDKNFFDNLLDHSISAIFLTTDFHPSGKQFSQAHLRTYNMEAMMEFINKARVVGFMPYGSIHYYYKTPMVYDYTFASLALHRKKSTHV